MKHGYYRIVLLAVLVLVTLGSNASEVGADAARSAATSFLRARNQAKLTTPDIALRLVHAQPSGQKAGAVDYYLFNVEGGDGYVVASGDDCVPLVLGYSDKGSLDMDRMPANMKTWLEEYSRQIAFMRENNLVYKAPLRATRTAISPLLKCYWGQNEPYDLLCPIDVNGDTCPTGCVATAMAQIMYYYRDRMVDRTMHDIPAYVTSTRHLNIEGVPAGSFIDWDNMLDRYTTTATEVQKRAVATLMKYCGTAVMMDYTNYSSGTYSSIVPTMMVAFFNFSSKMQRLAKSDYTYGQWVDMIYNELAQSRPVFYSGVLNLTGHAFVCDGYAEGDYFHINWGWGGDEGYYLLDVTSNSNTIPYKTKQNAVINIEPRPSLPDQGGIDFVDPIAWAACLLAGDTNDDGVLTTAEAAAVTDPTLLCLETTKMTSFDEYRHFTGLTTVPEGWLYCCDRLMSIVLPPEVTTIEDGAFYGCSALHNVALGTKVKTIGNSSFLGCSSLDTINLPNSLKTIGPYAFKQCTGLQSVNMGFALQTIGTNAFIGCSSIDSITTGNKLTDIGSAAFKDCTALKRVKLGNSVATIGGSAFAGCTALQSINIPVAVTSIGDQAFDKCRSLKEFTWDAAHYEDAFSIPSSVQRLTIGDAVKVIPDHFARGANLKSVSIGKSVTTVGNFAFTACAGLTTVNLPSGVTTIGDFAFGGCSGLSSLPLPHALVSVGNDAFSGCSGVTAVELPAALTTIGNNVFSNCTGLTSISIPNSVISIGDGVFNGCERLTNLTWDASACTATFSLPATVRSLTFGNNIEDVPESFAHGIGLTNLTLSAATRNVGASAFKGCNLLTSVTCQATVPPTAATTSFSNYLQATLYVPLNTVEAYKTANPWRRFSSIVGKNMNTGDVNLDGEVNIADVNAVIDNILTGLPNSLSDVNGDGEVNIADINALIDMILR